MFNIQEIFHGLATHEIPQTKQISGGVTVTNSQYINFLEEFINQLATASNRLDSRSVVSEYKHVIEDKMTEMLLYRLLGCLGQGVFRADEERIAFLSDARNVGAITNLNSIGSALDIYDTIFDAVTDKILLETFTKQHRTLQQSMVCAMLAAVIQSDNIPEPSTKEKYAYIKYRIQHIDPEAMPFI